jgi:hypothetical protein
MFRPSRVQHVRRNRLRIGMRPRGRLEEREIKKAERQQLDAEKGRDFGSEWCPAHALESPFDRDHTPGRRRLRRALRRMPAVYNP